MTARERILGRLRAAQQPFKEVAPVKARRPVIPTAELSADERLDQFIENAESLGCFVYQVDRSEAIEQIMDLLDGDKSLLSWDEAHLPLDDLHDMLESLGVSIAAHDDGDVRVGATGVDAALAATGSLVLESGAGRYRSASLLPDVHIALMRADQILPDLETWAAAQQQRGRAAFREASNTVIVTGPSKTADIGHQLVKGAHGPREVHILVLR
jgi:L-lactate dehydrogenase complex protein LldG